MKELRELASAEIAKAKHQERETIYRLSQRGITKGNYHLHLNEMSDQEITIMLDITEGKANMDSIRRAYPKQTDRTYADFIRDN